MPAAEVVADGRPPGALADAGVVRVAPQARLAEQQDDAEGDREERERGRARGAEAELVLRVDVDENVWNLSATKASNSTSASSTTSSMPPRSAGRSCGSTTRKKVWRALSPSDRARLLERRVEAAQRDGDEQEDDRVVGERDDPGGAEEALE